MCFANRAACHMKKVWPDQSVKGHHDCKPIYIRSRIKMLLMTVLKVCVCVCVHACLCVCVGGVVHLLVFIPSLLYSTDP